MVKEMNVTIKNRLVLEKRDINVYHRSTRTAHIISHECSIALPLRLVIEDDYLHISVVSGPGRLEGNCLVNIPSWMDFEISSAGDATMVHSGDRILVKIPPGPPSWQLKMTRSVNAQVNQVTDFIIVGDDRTGNL